MTTDLKSLALALATFGLACGGGAPAASTASAAAPAASQTVAAGPGAQFTLHPSLTSVCTQHLLLEGGQELAWTLYASPLPLEEMAAWYTRQLPESILETGSDEWTWRLPSAAAPARVLHLYAPERPGQPGCGTAPPPGSRSVVNLSHLYGP